MTRNQKVKQLDAHRAALLGDEVGIPLGRLRKVSVSNVADQAARAIADLGMTLAVTIDPDGQMALESPDAAADEDLVGVYRGTGIFSMSRVIYGDLRHEIDLRGMA